MVWRGWYRWYREVGINSVERHSGYREVGYGMIVEFVLGICHVIWT